LPDIHFSRGFNASVGIQQLAVSIFIHAQLTLCHMDDFNQLGTGHLPAS
jgi:hypothetical protein